MLVPGADPNALCEGLREAMALRGLRFEDASSWADNAETVLELLEGEPTGAPVAHNGDEADLHLVDST